MGIAWLRFFRIAPERWTVFAANLAAAALLRVSKPDSLYGLLSVAADRLKLPKPPEPPPVWSFDVGKGEPIHPAMEDIRRRFRRLGRALRRRRETDPSPDLLLPALKAALLAADAAGSGLPRTGEDIPAWIATAFPAARMTGADIESGVLAPRRAQIPGFQERDFQRRAAELGKRALLLAPCGVGKTVAGWRWVAAQLDRHPARRALFLYPTRATTTEGFRDYVSHAPEADAALLSATAAYELEGMFDNPEDPRGERSYETDGRLFAVGLWRKRVFSATVDQFLGFMQQVYKSACLLPVLADSVVVIDEVHSFDAALFATLTRFLESFDLPVLCMTASLTVARREKLQALGFEVYPQSIDDFAELEAQARAPRYQVETLPDQVAAREIASRAVGDGQRVLWVVNTVDRCQALARDLGELALLCYHSRFKLEDRNARHREVVARFAAGDSANTGRLAITTQVCEMSLDLDADVLITEWAPITAPTVSGSTAPFVTPSACHGLLLNLAGIEMRRDDGKSAMTLIGTDLPRAEIALGAVGNPGCHSLYQQLHNYPVGSSSKEHAPACKGSKYNITPARRAFLSDLRACVGVRGNDELADAVLVGLQGRGPRR